MSQVDELHAVELRMLDFIVKICDQHQIKYFLIGGSLLGAVRHQGFIPWDDDIDVGFLRSDYEKFILVANEATKNTHFRVVTDLSNNDYGFSFGKIVDTNTFVQEPQNLPNTAVNEVYVDLFQFDRLPEKHSQQKRQYLQYKFWNKMIFDRLNYGNPDRGVKLWRDHLLDNMTKRYTIDQMKQFRLSVMTKYEAINYTNFVNISSQYGFNKELLTIKESMDLIDVPFESLTVKIPKHYDAILKRMYGNYMELPSKEKRVYKHIDNLILN